MIQYKFKVGNFVRYCNNDKSFSITSDIEKAKIERISNDGNILQLNIFERKSKSGLLYDNWVVYARDFEYYDNNKNKSNYSLWKY